jgi:hypothetical protein
MHYAAGDKVVFRLIWQDYEGRGKAPTSFTVSLQQVDVDTGAETIVSPTLIAAANTFTGVYVYYYTVPASGNYSFCAQGVTADTTIMAMEVFGEFESGRAWVESAAVSSTKLDAIDVQIDGATLSVVSLISGSELTCYAGMQLVMNFTGMGNITDYNKLYFTAKESKTDADTDALIQVEKTAGLLVINKATAETAANGTLTVTDLVTGAGALRVAMAETIKLSKNGSAHWDLKAINTTSGATIVTEGNFIVDYNVTRKIS